MGRGTDQPAPKQGTNEPHHPDPGRCIDYPIPLSADRFPGWLGQAGQGRCPWRAQKGIGISTAAGSGAQEATR
jgi:hypothetical protein